jgi:hypothetical protein
MPEQELKNIDDYEVFLTERLTPSSGPKRVALAAAIAAWEAEDRRKKRGLAHSAPALGEKLAQELSVAIHRRSDPSVGDSGWAASRGGFASTISPTS